jgi:predicted Zn finger-like uncharacterized protein
MPIIVACPSCSGKLRVADELLGGKVRCPACNAIFTAESPPAPSDLGPEPESSWKNLNLERVEDSPAEGSGNLETSPAPDPAGPSSPLDEPEREPLREPAPPPSPAPIPVPNLALEIPSSSGKDSGVPGPIGAVELPPQEGDPVPPPRAKPEPEPPPRRSPPSGERTGTTLKECPGCGKFISKEARRCYHCGERFGRPDKDGEWERRVDRDRDRDFDRGPRRRPRFRRDTVPHRGGLILGLGIASLALLLMSSGCSAPLSVVLGLMAWFMGQADLRQIKANEMDPEGEGITQGGWICGIIGTILSGLIILGCGGFIGFAMWAGSQNARPTKPKFGPRPNFNQPIPPRRPPRF